MHGNVNERYANYNPGISDEFASLQCQSKEHRETIVVSWDLHLNLNFIYNKK